MALRTTHARALRTPLHAWCARARVWGGVGWGAPTGEQTGEFLTLLDLTESDRSERPSDCENKTTSCPNRKQSPAVA
jgi:hypothetical protein